MKKKKLFRPTGQSRINSQYFSQNYRQLLLRVLLVLCAVVAIGVTIVNLVDWGRDPGSKWGSYNLITDGITLALLACLYLANQRGFTSLAGWLLGLIMIAGIPTSYSVAELNQTFLIMLLPVTFSSFIIQPWASFLFVGLVTVFYHVTFFQHPGAFEYDAFSLATLLLMAVISYLVALVLNKAIGDTIRAYDETIQGWANALEMRDSETMGHSQRIVELTLILAKKLGVKDADLFHIRRGALLHDIGKMGIPDAILHKPGNLTEAEWKIMRKHPVYARSYLSAVSYLAPALDIPYSHHERWDGTGYPQGLKGDEIPLAARIFAIVDVWDALTSQRPYRGAWSPEKALAHIRQQAGKHFDPRVVDTFIELIGDKKV